MGFPRTGDLLMLVELVKPQLLFLFFFIFDP